MLPAVAAGRPARPRLVVGRSEHRDVARGRPALGRRWRMGRRALAVVRRLGGGALAALVLAQLVERLEPAVAHVALWIVLVDERHYHTRAAQGRKNNGCGRPLRGAQTPRCPWRGRRLCAGSAARLVRAARPARGSAPGAGVPRPAPGLPNLAIAGFAPSRRKRLSRGARAAQSCDRRLRVEAGAGARPVPRSRRPRCPGAPASGCRRPQPHRKSFAIAGRRLSPAGQDAPEKGQNARMRRIYCTAAAVPHTPARDRQACNLGQFL